jgi:hypothetical protein
MSDTGTTVVNMPREGQFDACMSRVSTCGYACCQFGKLGNWIYAFPGEVDLATEQGLSFAHLEMEPLEDGGHKVHCMRPCVGGEFKSIDCAIYPAWVANEAGTMFLVADNRKCPIPHNELLETLRNAQQVALDWEARKPGTLKGMAAAAKGFKAYQAFDHAIEFDGTVRKLTDEEFASIQPNELLEPGYIAKFKGIELEGYTGTTTPEDQPIPENTLVPPLKGSVEEAFFSAKHIVKQDSLSQLLENLGLFEAVFINPEGFAVLLADPKAVEAFEATPTTLQVKTKGHIGWFEIGADKVPVYTDNGRNRFMEFPYMARLRGDKDFMVKTNDAVHTAKPVSPARGVTKPKFDKVVSLAKRRAQRDARRNNR